MIARAVVLALVCAASLSAAGCKKGPNWKNQTYTEVDVKPQGGDIEVPESLWAKVLESQAPLKAKPKGEHGGGSETEDAKSPQTAMEPLKVYLIERNKGVLKGQNIALSFVAGGGQLNLSEYTSNLKGSYYIAFEFMPEVEKGETKVFFLSNSVLRKVGGVTLGSGCNTYFELSKRFAEAMKTDGFLVNTSDQRDVSALAGSYLFTQASGDKIHMATLIIKDDDHRALQCRH